MAGLIWVAAIWISVLMLARTARHRSRVPAEWLSPEGIALAIAIVGTFSVAGRETAEEVLRSPLAYERVLRGGIAALSLVIVAPILLRRLRTVGKGHLALGALTTYLLIAVVSTLYSAAPLVTAAKAGELAAGLAPIVATAIGPEPRRRLQALLLMVLALISALVTVGVVGFVVLPGIFSFAESRPGFLFRNTLGTPYAHSNALAAYGAIMAIFSLAMIFDDARRKRMWGLAGVIGAAAVILTSGRQGVAMLAVGAAIVLWVRRRSIFLLAIGPGLAGVFFAYQEPILDALSRDRPQNFADFTGRLYWWDAAVEAWSVHPWTGWGYSAGGRFVALTSIDSSSTSSVHSGFLEALVGVGVLGTIALVATVALVSVWSVQNLNSHPAISVLIVLLGIRTAVSMGFGGWLNPEFVLLGLLAAIADLRRRALNRPHLDTPLPAPAV